jgi:hypothetical protein
MPDQNCGACSARTTFGTCRGTDIADAGLERQRAALGLQLRDVGLDIVAPEAEVVEAVALGVDRLPVDRGFLVIGPEELDRMWPVKAIAKSTVAVYFPPPWTASPPPSKPSMFGESSPKAL